MMSPLRLMIVGAAVAAVCAWFFLRSGPQETPVPPLRASPQAAEPPPKVHLPAPRLAAQPPADPDPVPVLSRIQKMKKGEALEEIKTERLEKYLSDNHRNAASLLAAFRLTGDKELLREAGQKFPDDPRVAYESWFRAEDKVERQKWLDTWEKASPDNALASYLSAANLFKRGETDAALEKLESAARKPGFSYFSRQTIQDTEEAYKAAGYTEPEAKMAATWGLLLPHLAELKSVAQSLAELSATYRHGGDAESANAAIALGMQLANRIGDGPSFMIEDLVGIASQRLLMKGMDPASPSPVEGKTVQQLSDELTARREALKAAAKQHEAFIEQVSEDDLARYCDRLKFMGEAQAMKWLVDKYQPSGP